MKIIRPINKLSNKLNDNYNHLLHIENKFLEKNHIDNIPEFNEISYLIEWIWEVTVRNCVSIDVYLLSIQILNRCLNRTINRNMMERMGRDIYYKIMAASSLHLASKILVEQDECYHIYHDELIDHCDDDVNYSDLLLMERYILEILDWKVEYPTTFDFFTLICEWRENNQPHLYDKEKFLTLLLLELSSTFPCLWCYNPSLQAASCFYLSRLILGLHPWSKQLASFTHYRQSDMFYCAEKINEIYFKEKSNPDDNYVICKYLSPCYEWASTHEPLPLNYFKNNCQYLMQEI